MNAFDSLSQRSMAAQQAPLYEPMLATSVESPTPTTIMAAAEMQMHVHTRALIEVVGRLQEMRDRAFGADPVDDGKGQPPTPHPAGYAARLADATRPHDGLISRMHALINDLERLV